MALSEEIEQLTPSAVHEKLSAISEQNVLTALGKESCNINDFIAFISPAATPLLEEMAKKANSLTRHHFGNAILLFTPLYISDLCENGCSYCSFATHHKIKRHHMLPDEIEREAALITETGIRHILLLTGEAPNTANIDYLVNAVTILKKYFSAPAIEVYPLHGDGYAKLASAGADALTIYQETYNKAMYRVYHKSGPKADYDFRLNAPQRALENGFRAVTIGPLLGLADPYSDVLSAAHHFCSLEEQFPHAELSFSLPRIRPIGKKMEIACEVNDRTFVQFIIALRLFKPYAGITVSTRETAGMRNALLNLGITKMSAGVSTAVGGHSSGSSTGQFEISDSRTVEEMKRDLLKSGFQPVMQDWHHKLSLNEN